MTEQRKKRTPKKFTGGAKVTIAALSLLSFISGWNLIARHENRSAQADTPPSSPPPPQPIIQNLPTPTPYPLPTIPPLPTLPPIPTLVPTPVVNPAMGGGVVAAPSGNADPVSGQAAGGSPVQLAPLPTVAPLPTLAPLPPMPAMPELPPPPPMPTWNGGGGGGNHSGGS